MLQFTKMANVYWGLGVFLQSYKPIRTANPFLVLFFLLFVVLVGVFKEWWSDSKRQKADRLVNRKSFQKIVSMIVDEKMSTSGAMILEPSDSNI